VNYKEDEQSASGLSLKVWLRLLRYFKQIKKRVAAAIVVIVITMGTVSAYPLFTRYAVDNFVIPGSTEGLAVFVAVYL